MKVENMQVRAANGVCVWVPRRRCSDTARTHTALGVDARVYGVFRFVPTLVTLFASWKSAMHRMMPATAAEIAAIVIFCWINGPDAL